MYSKYITTSVYKGYTCVHACPITNIHAGVAITTPTPCELHAYDMHAVFNLWVICTIRMDSYV